MGGKGENTLDKKLRKIFQIQTTNNPPNYQLQYADPASKTIQKGTGVRTGKEEYISLLGKSVLRKLQICFDSFLVANV